MTALTQEALKKRLHYSAENGLFKWRINKQRISAGSVAGHAAPGGYVIIGLFGKLEYAHRLAWLYVHGYTPEGYMDHIDRNKHNNKIKNLRVVSPTCNARNKGVICTNKTGVVGVSWCDLKKKWQVFIKIKRKSYFLGYYKDFDDAVCVRLAAEQCLGWAGCDSSSTAYRHVLKIQKSYSWDKEKKKEEQP